MDETLTLAGGRVAVSATESVRANVQMKQDRIHRLGRETGKRVLDLEGFLILPGLINAHDHLEFNLFPRLGRGPYANATEWAEEIYRPDEAPVRQHLRVPKTIRLLWGGIKNLLSGATTVCHHNPYLAAIFEQDFPVRVLKRFGWAHSLRFCSEGDVEERFRATPPDAPFIIHAAEGKDAEARREIFTLEETGVLGASTVIVHGVALEREALNLIRERRTSLVWCPSSNEFTLGATLSPEVLESSVPIALGSDSGLTADGDLIDEITAAQRYIDREHIFEMVTAKAARILRLQAGEGELREGGLADVIAVREQTGTPAQTLQQLRPELVIIGGKIKLISAELASALKFAPAPGFEAIEMEGRGRFYVAYPVSELAARAKAELGDTLRLAGRTVQV